ncbi:MAG TPA: hypothetical protein PKC14_01055, partial [Candidatus Absconditabacterales bacterium]|nr:hypothetical protein [Candidatus Absconditabacterales bacterium]
MFYFFSDKRTISSFLAIYVASLLLNVFLFVPKFANAEPTISPNHLIAVVVDADLYDDLSLKKEIVWYARNYLQSQFSDSKALVLPLDKKNFKAKDIVKILENMYFEGVKDKTSDLVGIVLIGDMPLPVVKKNGFIFPSVFPYVDFRDQKYVYDEKSQFFEYNDKPYSVPEIWHGLIQLGSGTNAYLDYFEKLRKYAAQPAAFIDKAIWYDDFVELKKSFNSANLPYYIHNFLFSEDVGFHRFTNLIPDYFKGPSGDGVSALMTDLNSIDTQGTDPTSQMAAQYLTTMNAAASQMPATTSSQATPTLFLKKMVSELVKPYSENFGTLSLSRARDNILAGGRYKQFDSHLEKIVSKDALLLGNFGAEQDFTQPLTEISMKLEKALDDKIQQEKYFMKIPILTIYEKYKNRVQGSNFIACTFGELLLEGRYENFYFGKRASDVNSVQDLSIYRGSYKNFSSLDVLTGEDIISGSDVQTDSSLWSVGASYGLNDRQIEAHKGYNFDKSKDDIAVYNSRQDPNGLNECYQECQIRDQGSFTPAPPAECSSDYGSQSQVMAMDKFLWYYWGGVTPLNITGFDGNLSLKNFDYKYTRNPSVTSSPAGLAGGPIYDIAGAKLIGPSRTVSSLDGPLTVGGEVTTGYSYLGYKDFSSIQRIKLQYGYKTVNDPLDFLTLSFSSPGEEVVASYCFPQERIDGRIPYSDVEFFDIFKNKFPDNGEKVTIKVNGTSFNQTVRDDQCAQVSVLGGTITIGGNYKNTYEYDYKTFDTRNEMKAPTVAQITGMNLYTSDRPVDSVRYVNFQGIGGDLVKFVYPNLYNVEVFKRDGLVQTLKTPDEINSSIKDYLRKKVVLYNSSLTQQQAKRQNFYTQNQSAFDFLSVSDPLATPNRTYNLMPVDYFIDTLGEETISNAAYFLYYQNLGWSQKTSSTGVIDDLEAKKQSFDLNPKISHVMRYLQYGLNDGLSSGTIALRNAFYQSGGYELAYLNSDGFDYIQDESQVPSFIQRIQSAQARYDQDVAPRINDDLDLEIQKDRSECSLDADGSVSLDKWPEALKCWLKKTLKTQILTIDYKNSQGPVFVTDAIKALGSIFRGVDQNPQNLGSEIQDYALNIGKFSDQWSRIAQAKSDNENLLLSLSDVQKNKLQGIWDFINPRFMQKFDGLVPDLEVADNFYVEPVESYEQKKYFSLGLNAGSQDFGSVDISFSSTGNNCIVINSKNLCQQSYSLSDVDLFSQPLLLDLDLATKKAGLLMLDVKICDGQACIILPQTISIVPGAIDSISMVSPSSKILRGASLPFVVNAYDKRGNTISRVSDNYFVAVASGKNLYDGSFYSSFDVDSFENLYFLYDSSSLSGGNSSYDQISIQPSTSGFVNGLPANQKTIQLVDGTVRVSRGGVAVNQLSYKLPEAGSDLVSVDSQGLSQIAENNLVALSIDVKDLAGQGIYSQVSVKTKNALLKPGTVATGQVEQIVSGAIQSFVQETFVSHTNFLASNGTVTVYFYPSFQAGQDEIVISVPGSQDISIPVVVEPSSPKIVQVITDSDQ